MPELSEVLARLGLLQYLGRLNEEGFEKWETVLDITEQDLTTLNFKLGHRRILQREIASARGVPPNQPLTSSQFVPIEEVDLDEKSSAHGYKVETNKGSAPTGKRKYRRHPKPDENAPEKPPSAYVMFANRVRDELKGQNLSFTDIAKLVGEKWKVLDPDDKESYELEASAAKEKFNSELQEYKKTDSYKEYVKYLAEFKSKTSKESKENTEPSEAARKRPRLDSLPSSSSMGTVSTAGSAGSVSSALSATAPPTSMGNMPSIGPGKHPSTQSAYVSSPAQIPSSSIHASGTQSMPVNPLPRSPPQPSSGGTETGGYRDPLTGAMPHQQDETSIPLPSESDAHYFARIHPTAHSPHIQQQSSYLRHQSSSVGPQPLSRGSGAMLPSVMRHSSRLDEQFSPASASISGSISSSGSSSAPSLTPSLDDGSRGHRSLPLPPGMGPSTSSSGYFDQRSHHYQQTSQPAPRQFPQTPLGPPAYSSSPSSSTNPPPALGPPSSQ